MCSRLFLFVLVANIKGSAANRLFADVFGYFRRPVSKKNFISSDRRFFAIRIRDSSLTDKTSSSSQRRFKQLWPLLLKQSVRMIDIPRLRNKHCFVGTWKNPPNVACINACNFNFKWTCHSAISRWSQFLNQTNKLSPCLYKKADDIFATLRTDK